MNKRIVTSPKGFTLVEILASLAIISIISVAIVGNLLGGMKSFQRVNDEVLLHDEANQVMSQFTNYIMEATLIEDVEQSDSASLIRITNYDGVQTEIGFKNNQAVINGAVIHPSTYSFPSGGVGTDTSKIIVQDDTVFIKMVIQDEQLISHKKLELENEVSYIKFYKETE